MNDQKKEQTSLPQQQVENADYQDLDIAPICSSDGLYLPTLRSNYLEDHHRVRIGLCGSEGEFTVISINSQKRFQQTEQYSSSFR